jgi:Fe-S oxidoreductase
MLLRKKAALGTLADEIKSAPLVTNCPSCLQGLSRNDHPGTKPVHLAVLLARANGGEEWQGELAKLLERTEVVNF